MTNSAPKNYLVTLKNVALSYQLASQRSLTRTSINQLYFLEDQRNYKTILIIQEQ